MPADSQRLNSNMFNTPHSVWLEAAGSAVSFLVGGILAWLLASLSKVSKKSLQEQFVERDKLIFQPLKDEIHEIRQTQRQELAEIKAAHKDFITRTELKAVQDSILQRLDDLANTLQACMARGDTPRTRPRRRS